MYACKYDFEDVIVIFGDGSESTIPKNNIASALIEKNFEGAFFPIFSIKGAMERKLYDKIILDSSKVKFKIRVNKFYVKSSTDIIQSKTAVRPFLNLVFNMITDNATPYKENELDKQRKDTEKKSGNDPSKDNTPFEFFLFVEHHLHRYRKINNVILSELTVSDALLFLFSKCNFDNILLSDPDNYTKFKQIILPPFTLLGGIDYLQKVYGIYNKGYTLFNDLGITYMISGNPKCTALRENEYSRVYMIVNENTSNAVFNPGFEIDSTNARYNINLAGAPTITDGSDMVKNQLFDRAMVINTYNGKLTDKKLSLGDEQNLIKIFDDRYDNQYAINSELYKIQTSNSTSINIQDIDVDILTINKEYYFDYRLNRKEYKAYNGIYKLTNLICIFDRQQSEFFSVNTSCSFKQT